MPPANTRYPPVATFTRLADKPAPENRGVSPYGLGGFAHSQARQAVYHQSNGITALQGILAPQRPLTHRIPSCTNGQDALFHPLADSKAATSTPRHPLAVGDGGLQDGSASRCSTFMPDARVQCPPWQSPHLGVSQDPRHVDPQRHRRCVLTGRPVIRRAGWCGRREGVVKC